VLTWSFSTDKRQRASRACEVSSLPLLCFGWNLGCAVGSLARPRLAGRLRRHRLSCLGSNRAPSISRIRDADQSPLPDLPCPQSTDTLSPLQPQIHPHFNLRARHGSSRQPVQVRCDAASLGVPCTNCTAFQIECRIPTPKRKKVQTSAQTRDSDRYI
jgi:hypothetical protein